MEGGEELDLYDDVGLTAGGGGGGRLDMVKYGAGVAKELAAERLRAFAAVMRASPENRFCVASLVCWLLVACCIVPVVLLVAFVVGVQELYRDFIGNLNITL
jgi:hypothetical protein